MCHRSLHLPENPLQYVELETLGPLTTMNPKAQPIQQTTVYTVKPRSTTDLDAEARKAFQ